MAKSATKVAKPSKAESKSVKSGGITKSSQTPKAKAKDAAKATAKNIEKKKKKAVESDSDDSDSEDESESEADSDDSDSDASEEEAPKKPVTNGKKAKATESSDEDSDDSDSDESEDEKPAPKTNGAAKTNGKKAAEESDSDDSDSDSDEEEEKAAPKANGAKKADSDSEDDSDDSDDSDSDEEEKTEAAPSKKRKAEEEIDEAPKKAKADDAATTLFAGSLSWGVDDDALYEAFKSFGNLVGARVVTDKNTGRSRGFGYVDFADSESATKAYEAMQGQEVDGRAINLDYANAKPAEAKPQDRAADRAKRHGDTLSAESETLFVGNLPFDTEQEAVREFFAEVAEVASVRLPTDPESGNLKGFGYVTFNSIEDAKTALEAKNGAAIGNGRMSRAVRLDFAGSRPPQNGGGGGFGGRGGGRGGFGGRGGGRGGPRGGGGRGGFGGRGGGRGGFNSPRGGGGGGFSGTKISFD